MRKRTIKRRTINKVLATSILASTVNPSAIQVLANELVEPETVIEYVESIEENVVKESQVAVEVIQEEEVIIQKKEIIEEVMETVNLSLQEDVLMTNLENIDDKIEDALTIDSETMDIPPSNSVMLQRASVARVIDGDTVVLRWEDGVERSTRLIGIDAPELSDEHGNASRQFLEELLPVGSVVYTRGQQGHGSDVHNRARRYVYLSNPSQNGNNVQDLVQYRVLDNGWAMVSVPGNRPTPNYYVQLRDAEAQAQESGRGIWYVKTPETPNDENFMGWTKEQIQQWQGGVEKFRQVEDEFFYLLFNGWERVDSRKYTTESMINFITSTHKLNIWNLSPYDLINISGDIFEESYRLLLSGISNNNRNKELMHSAINELILRDEGYVETMFGTIYSSNIPERIYLPQGTDMDEFMLNLHRNMRAFDIDGNEVLIRSTMGEDFAVEGKEGVYISNILISDFDWNSIHITTTIVILPEIEVSTLEEAKSELQTLLDSKLEFVETGELVYSDFTEASWNRFINAKSVAMEVLARLGMNSNMRMVMFNVDELALEELNAAMEELQAAFAALTPVVEDDATVPTPETPEMDETNEEEGTDAGTDNNGSVTPPTANNDNASNNNQTNNATTNNQNQLPQAGQFASTAPFAGAALLGLAGLIKKFKK